MAATPGRGAGGNGCKLTQKFVAHSGNVNAVAIGRKSSNTIATAGDDKLLNIWQIGRVNCAHKLAGHTSAVEAVSFDCEENNVVGGSASGALKLWDLATGKIVRSLPGHKANIRSLDFHPFGEFFASGSLDTNLKVWDIRRKGCIQQYKGHSDTINCLRFSPDGRWIVSGSEDSVIKLWDLTAGKMIHEFTDHSGPITSMEFHPNEFLLATASADRTIKFWDLEKFTAVSSTDREASRRRVIAFDQEGTKLYSGGHDSLRTYRWEPAEQLNSMAPSWGDVCDMCPDRNEGLVATSIYQNMVSVWEVTKESLLAVNPDGDLSSKSGTIETPVNRAANPSATVIIDRSTPSVPTDLDDPDTPFESRPKVGYSPPHSPVDKSGGEPEEVRPKASSSTSIAPPPAAAVKATPAARIGSAGKRLPVAAAAVAASVSSSSRGGSRPTSSRSSSSSLASRPPRSSSAPVTAPVKSKPAAASKAVGTIREESESRSSAGTPVVPAQRDRPLGLNMAAFLPADAQVVEPVAVQDRDIIDGVTTGHASMLNILAMRLRNTRIVRSHWTAGNHKVAVETMLELKDQSVVVDVLNVMKLKPKLWTLDLSIMILPECAKLLESQFESHVTTGASTLQMITDAFGNMVAQNLRSPPAPGGIDISREERYERCVKFRAHVKSLRKAIEPRLDTAGKIGSQLRSLDKALQVFV